MQETATFRAKSGDETGAQRVEQVEVPNKHAEKKLVDKGLHRMDRRPVDGQPIYRQRKAGHGGKYTWEGPVATEDEDEEDVEAAAVMDENDPNYVDEEAEGRILRGEVSGVEGMVVGEVEVAKMAEEGVSRVEVDPRLRTNVD